MQIINNLNQIIDNQIKNLQYSSINSTKLFKEIAYLSIRSFLNDSNFVDYLINNTRSGGYQSKLFQKYIEILEQNFPISFVKNKKTVKISSLLDNNLNIFDGISKFTGIIDEKLRIKNQTKELYIGGRTGSYVLPYYIGKILEIRHSETKEDLKIFMKEYNFSQIKFHTLKPKTPIIITHLRIVPHYQFGAMTYINRARKSIIKIYKQNI